MNAARSVVDFFSLKPLYIFFIIDSVFCRPCLFSSKDFFDWKKHSRQNELVLLYRLTFNANLFGCFLLSHTLWSRATNSRCWILCVTNARANISYTHTPPSFCMFLFWFLCSFLSFSLVPSSFVCLNVVVVVVVVVSLTCLHCFGFGFCFNWLNSLSVSLCLCLLYCWARAIASL